jgi:polysaccharide biosynthesis/export protein
LKAFALAGFLGTTVESTQRTPIIYCGAIERGLKMMHKLVLCFGLAVVATPIGWAQNAATGPALGQQSSPDSARVRTPISPGEQRYRLRPGDSFDVDFALSPEFNQTVSVQPDGYGSLKGVDAITVQGKTIPELTEAIRAAYASILHNPRVVVVLKDFDKPYFVAAGQVVRPGKYDLRSELTVTAALAVAGGVSEKGKTSEIILYRKSPDGSFQGKVLNLKRLLASHNLSEDPRLQPGDMLYVPQNISSHLRPYIPTATAGAFYNPIPY